MVDGEYILEIDAKEKDLNRLERDFKNLCKKAEKRKGIRRCSVREFDRYDYEDD